MKTSTKKGILLAVIAASISGFSIFYNKQIVVKGVDPLIFNIIKNGGVAIILSMMLLSRGKAQLLIKQSKIQWAKLWLIALIGGSIPFLLYFEGLRSVSAINANLIQKTLFIWVAMMAIPFLGERLSKIQIIGYALIAWSNIFLGGMQGFAIGKGELLILSATLLWSVENVVAKVVLKNSASLLVAWARMALGVVILISLAIVQGKLGLLFTFPQAQLLLVVGSIILLTAYVSSWIGALKHAPATLVTSILILATPITNVLSAIFITRTLTVPQLTNLAGSLFGVLLIALLPSLITTLKKPKSIQSV